MFLLLLLQDGDDVMQLLQMDMVDEDSQHTAALLSKAASAPAAAVAARQGSDLLQPTLQLAGHSMPAQSRLAGSKLKQQTGPGKQPAPAVDAAAPGGGASSKAGGSAGGFSFQVFGKDLTNSNKQQKSKQQQVRSMAGGQEVYGIGLHRVEQLLQHAVKPQYQTGHSKKPSDFIAGCWQLHWQTSQHLNNSTGCVQLWC